MTAVRGGYNLSLVRSAPLDLRQSTATCCEHVFHGLASAHSCLGVALPVAVLPVCTESASRFYACQMLVVMYETYNLERRGLSSLRYVVFFPAEGGQAGHARVSHENRVEVCSEMDGVGVLIPPERSWTD